MPAKMEGDLDDLPEPKRTQMKKEAMSFKRFYEDANLLPDAVHSYLACMSYADAMIGRVLKALAASPYANNTIIVLWSDNGFHYGEKGHYGKKELWQRSTNIPFVWAGPGVAKGIKTKVPVSLIDMYPTFVEMCALPTPPQKLEGVSLATTLKNPAKAKDRDIYVPHTEPNGYAIINQKWRYIKYADDTEELYNVQEDPNEWTNLANNPEYAELKKALKAKAPKTFAQPARNTTKKNLVIEGESYHWDMTK
jgi:arylsulfatase A-like enzyme